MRTVVRVWSGTERRSVCALREPRESAASSVRVTHFALLVLATEVVGGECLFEWSESGFSGV